MTPQELDAIRARDAACYIHPEEKTGPWADRRALLAEVDRLTALTEHPQPFALYWMGVERARIRSVVERLPVGNTWVEYRAAVLAAIDGGGSRG